VVYLNFSPLAKKEYMDKIQFRDMREYFRRLDGMSKAEADIEIKKTMAEIKGLLNPGRNEPCPCGSGKKFKKCCL
jgi:preprotein translocase subunit SecA